MSVLKKQLFIICCFITIPFLAQEKATLSGTVYDNASNETLIGVSIYFPELNVDYLICQNEMYDKNCKL